MSARASLLLATALACHGADAPPPLLVDPRFQALGDAEHAWQIGSDALGTGDAATARDAFGRALAAQPDDPLLTLWMARAEAAAGDLPAALRRLDGRIERVADDGAAVWQRACLRARAGDAKGAADDVRRAIALGVVTPRRAVRDADIAAARARPELAFLPDAPFEVEVRAPRDGSAVGATSTLELVVHGADPGPLTLDAHGTGAVSVLRVEEEVGLDDVGDERRVLTWTLRADAPGEVRLDDAIVSQGALRVRLREVRWRAGEFVGHAAAPVLSWALTTPSGVLGVRVPPDAWQDSDGAWVAIPSGSELELDGQRARSTPWVLRADGRELVRLYRLDLAAGVHMPRIRVVGDGGPLWEAAPR